VRTAVGPHEARAAILSRFPALALEMAVESAVVAHAPRRD
jgi:hypothetical protein